MSYTGTDRQHDIMDREARQEGAYNDWEKRVLAEMRPHDIPEMLWRAQWGHHKFRYNIESAMEDAKTMALEVGQSTTVQVFRNEDETLHFCFARPLDDCYSERAVSKEARFKFKMLLVKEHRFPDISKFAGKDEHDVRACQSRVLESYRKMAESGFVPEFDDIPF